MSILELKLLLLLVILASGWIGGLIPLLKTNTHSPRFLALGNAFAAGIFLGIGLIHMLGDASDTWSTTLGQDYPVAPLLAGAAFLTLLCMEHVALRRTPLHSHQAGDAGITPAQAAQATEPDEFAQLEQPASGLYPYALITALSIHSVIAGVAMGAQGSLASVMLIFVAIAAHKSTAGFALGVSLARSKAPRRRSLLLIGLFSIMTPIGIAIGLLVRGALEGHAQTVFEAAFLALAAGSFIYIAALDIIREEFMQPGSHVTKWALAVAGYGLMGLLALWL